MKLQRNTADDDVIAEVACFDEFGGYISVGSTWFGVVGWVVVIWVDGDDAPVKKIQRGAYFGGN